MVWPFFFLSLWLVGVVETLQVQFPDDAEIISEMFTLSVVGDANLGWRERGGGGIAEQCKDFRCVSALVFIGPGQMSEV